MHSFAIIIGNVEDEFMANKLNLDIQTILDKQFNVDFKGYCATEVDGFLDLVLEDYDFFQTVMREMNEKLGEYERLNATLRAQIIELDGRTRAMGDSTGVVSQVDLLKRLSRLEQVVYGNKE